MKRLRILGLTIKVNTVWVDDDRPDMPPGPDLNPVSVPFAELGEFAKQLPAQINELTEQLLAQETDTKPANRAARRTTPKKRAPVKAARRPAKAVPVSADG